MGQTTSTLEGPDFTAGIDVDALPEGAPQLGHAHGESVVLVKRGGSCFAVSATCTHYSGPLAQGIVENGTIRCPWHHARFDLATGAAVGGPGLGALGCYEVEQEGKLVRVGKKRDAASATTRRVKVPHRPDSVVIIGSGPAGVVAAETLRTEGYDGSITMVGAEGVPVDRPNLSKDYLAGNAPEEWIPIRDKAAIARARVTLEETNARSLDVEKKQLVLENGKTLTFDALILATGAEPVRLDIPGATLPHVHVLRTLADSRAIIGAVNAGARRAVVIGGGFIGLEVAASLRARDVDVTVVLREAVPLERVLGEQLGRFVEQLHSERGVRFVRGTPASIGEGQVTLASGELLSAELVVMGVGVRPRVELALGAGLRVDNGIVVDATLQTSAPGVYAAGDVARAPWGTDGNLVRVEHFVHAERMGFVAARNVLGHQQRFEFAPFFWSQHYDVPIAYVGAGPWDAVELVGDAAKRDVLAIYRAKGRVVALATIYRDIESLRVEALLERGDLPGIEAVLRAAGGGSA